MINRKHRAIGKIAVHLFSALSHPQGQTGALKQASDVLRNAQGSLATWEAAYFEGMIHDIEGGHLDGDQRQAMIRRLEDYLKNRYPWWSSHALW